MKLELDEATISRSVAEFYAIEIGDRARATAPVKTGEYVGAIRTSGTKVSATAPHSAIVEFGTDAHLIVGSPVLAFEINGMKIYTDVVDHRGTRAQKILENAVLDVLPN